MASHRYRSVLVREFAKVSAAFEPNVSKEFVDRFHRDIGPCLDNQPIVRGVFGLDKQKNISCCASSLNDLPTVAIEEVGEN